MKEETIAVIGLGYVGLPLAGAFDQAGYPVLGFDVDESKMAYLARGENYLKHLGDDFTRKLAASERFEATTDPARLREADAILLCVPTPLGEHNEPDLRYVLDSTRMVAEVLQLQQIQLMWLLNPLARRM